MFGHQDEPAQQTTTDTSQSAPALVDTGTIPDALNPALPPADMNFAPTPPPAIPTTDPNSLLEPQATDGFTTPPADPTPISDAPTQEQSAPALVGTPSPLNDLKQQALQQLSPLVDHLDQTPEEKFRTTMMMIQAADNQDLLQTAYDAANQITDEKAKAQALLDVINEINYFTQQQNS